LNIHFFDSVTSVLSSCKGESPTFVLPEAERLHAPLPTARKIVINKSIDLSVKYLLDSEMKTKTIALSLGLVFAAGALYAADPMMGTWKLNQSKSKLTRGTAMNTKVVYDDHLIRNKVTVTTDGVDAEGRPAHGEWKGKFNGKDYEVTGDPTADTRAYTKVNDQTLDMIGKKGGKVVTQGRIVVSADGKTRVVTLHGTTAKGKKFTNTAVYDKE
jgi:hypothetical protein